MKPPGKRDGGPRKETAAASSKQPKLDKSCKGVKARLRLLARDYAVAAHTARQAEQARLEARQRLLESAPEKYKGEGVTVFRRPHWQLTAEGKDALRAHKAQLVAQGMAELIIMPTISLWRKGGK